ncbi:MAG: hypothetical protein A2V90_05940 [Gammaproteobacteria bacterium RBG_16_57_12]|nr:MAG: hypothetical protein A2V90_05940 [Gammaproteobacteria bacterium RBG_16_57_12]
MNYSELYLVIDLIHTHRWAALSCLYQGEPLAGMVAYVAEADLSGFLLHLSQLAPHTRGLLEHPRAALVISEADRGEGDPQILARLILQGRITVIKNESEDYLRAKAHYIQRLPAAEPRFEFGDFQLFRLTPETLRYVGGFAQAHRVTVAQLQAAQKQKRRP